MIKFFSGRKASLQDKEVFVSLLQSAGTVVELPEAQIDAATALAGCGTSFLFIFLLKH